MSLLRISKIFLQKHTQEPYVEGLKQRRWALHLSIPIHQLTLNTALAKCQCFDNSFHYSLIDA